jgi:hypothetical protein
VKRIKISLDDADIMQKHRVQTTNHYVSSHVENFTVGSKACYLGDKYDNKDGFGISKEVLRVSNRNFVHGWLGNINGGS